MAGSSNYPMPYTRPPPRAHPGGPCSVMAELLSSFPRKRESISFPFSPLLKSQILNPVNPSISPTAPHPFRRASLCHGRIWWASRTTPSTYHQRPACDLLVIPAQGQPPVVALSTLRYCQFTSRRFRLTLWHCKLTSWHCWLAMWRCTCLPAGRNDQTCPRAGGERLISRCF